jgi:predicted acetyltransferase
MILESNRLKLIPMNLQGLKDSIRSKEKLEREIGLNLDEASLYDKMKKIYQKKIDKISKNPKEYLYYTYWQIVDKENNLIMGSIAFKGTPNFEGEIEVGYGLSPNYRGYGYMTEALKELVNWAFNDHNVNVKSVLASTLKDNTASQNVLVRSLASKYDENEDYYCFRIDNNS